jgi:hypothetical protein
MAEIKVKAKPGKATAIARIMKEELQWVGPFDHLMTILDGRLPLSGERAFTKLCEAIEHHLGPVDDHIELL